MQLLFISCPKLEQPDLLHGAAQAVHHLNQEKKKNPKSTISTKHFDNFYSDYTIIPLSHATGSLSVIYASIITDKTYFFTHSLSAFTALLTEVVLKLL